MKTLKISYELTHHKSEVHQRDKIDGNRKMLYHILFVLWVLYNISNNYIHQVQYPQVSNNYVNWKKKTTPCDATGMKYFNRTMDSSGKRLVTVHLDIIFSLSPLFTSTFDGSLFTFYIVCSKRLEFYNENLNPLLHLRKRLFLSRRWTLEG